MNHVKVHRTLAVIWVAVGVASFVFGVQDSVVLQRTIARWSII